MNGVTQAGRDGAGDELGAVDVGVGNDADGRDEGERIEGGGGGGGGALGTQDSVAISTDDGGSKYFPSKDASTARIRWSSGGWVAQSPPNDDRKPCAKKKWLSSEARVDWTREPDA